LSYAVDRSSDVCYLYSGTAYNTMNQIDNLNDGWTQQYYDNTCRIPTMCNIQNALNEVELQEVYPCDGQAAAQAACAAADSCSSYGVRNNVCFLYSGNAFDTMTDTNNLYPGWSLQYFDLTCQITTLYNAPGLYNTVEQQEIYPYSEVNGPNPNIGQTACEDLPWGCLSFAMDNTDDPACYLYSDTAPVTLSQTENLWPQCPFNVTYWDIACPTSSPECGPLTCGLSSGWYSGSGDYIANCTSEADARAICSTWTRPANGDPCLSYAVYALL
jgi:hypothetical protein